MDFRVVILEAHAIDLVPRQLPYRLAEIRVLEMSTKERKKALHPFKNVNLERDGVSVHRVFTAEHEADLAARVRRDGAVSVVHYGEEGLAEGVHFFDQLQVKPLALSCKTKTGRTSEHSLTNERDTLQQGDSTQAYHLFKEIICLQKSSAGDYRCLRYLTLINKWFMAVNKTIHTGYVFFHATTFAIYFERMRNIYSESDVGRIYREILCVIYGFSPP